MSSERDSLAANNLRFAFHRRLPDTAVRYFIQRAANPDLKWPITYMLHGVDQPDAVEFVVRELATISEAVDGTGNFSTFVLTATDDWRRKQEENGRAMSLASRQRLRDTWQDQNAGAHLRKQAFRIWASTHRVGDVDVLRTVTCTDLLADKALWQRLRLGDYDAIPALQQKLLEDQNGYWWQLGKYVWSTELSEALNEAFERRRLAFRANGHADKKDWELDWVLSELVMFLPASEADSLLNRHWDHLGTSGRYIVAAISTATHTLQARISDAIRNAPEPKKLFKHFSMHFNLKRQGRPSLFRPEQIEAVVPYLDLLDGLSIHDLWNVCNKHGWFTLRRAYLDSRFPTTMRGASYLDASRAMQDLDEFSENGKQWFVEHWIDHFLECGVSLDDVMELIGQWLRTKTDIRFLQLACAAVLHAGERRHLNLLANANIEPAASAAVIVQDTEFCVRRRTLRT
jgi:hypothetical protein